VNASGADDISLATGLGSVSGTFAVVVQDNNTVDAPEFVVMTGSFGGSMDFRQAFAANVPLGYLTGGQAFAAVRIVGEECAQVDAAHACVMGL